MNMRDFDDQVKSGFRLALTVVGTFLLLGALGIGMMAAQAGTLKGVSVGVLFALIPIVILWLTVGYWAKWFCAACALGTLRILVACALGRTISVPSLVVPRIPLVEIAAGFALLTFLSSRYFDAKPNRLDTVCLIGALMACLASLSSKSTLKWVLVAILLLGVCNVYDRFSAPRQIRKYPSRS
ncbi:MAG: hypothetical protein WAO35_02085 [Terriglobia bacterium]